MLLEVYDKLTLVFSIDVAQLILQQYYSDSTESLLDRRLLETQHILELGFALPVFFCSLPSSN